MAFGFDPSSGQDFWDQFPVHPSSPVTAPTTPTPNTGVSGTGTPGTPGTPPAAPTPAPTGGGGVTMDDFNRAWMASPFPGTVDGLKQFYASDPKWAAAGVTLGGSKGDKVYGPGGSYWGDYVISAGTGGAGKSTGSGPSSGGGGAAGGGGNPYGFGGYGSFVTPMSEFTPPTEQDALNSPGLQFALSEANRMGQNSAAAKGTLLNGRFQQALAGSNIQNALQGYGDVYNRAANTFGMNYDVQKRNQDSPFDKNVTLAKLGAPQ